jgi:putative ABC transport system permease protein
MRREFASDYPDRSQWRMRAIVLRNDLFGESRSSLLLLFGAVGLVLLLACSSVANLHLARATARTREFAVRSALGASRRRLIAQVLGESLLFSAVGGVAGIILAGWATSFLSGLGTIRAATNATISVDPTVLGFTVIVSVVSGLVAGLAPALRSSRPDVRMVLQGASRTEGWGRGLGRLRSGLVAVQYAFAVILLIAASLLVRTFRNLQNVPLGFDPENVLTAAIWLPQPNDRASGPYFSLESRQAFYRGVIDRVSAIPGAESVALGTQLPLGGGLPRTSFTIEGDATETEPPVANVLRVSALYFGTLGIPVLSGRTLRDDDPRVDRASFEVVVNREFVDRYLAGRDPIGQQLHFGGRGATGPAWSIAGVVENVPGEGLDRPIEPLIYASIFAQGPASLVLAVRGPDAARLAGRIRVAMQQVDANMPLFAVTTLDRIVAGSTAQRRIAMVLFAIFGFIALAIATVGVYGIVSFSVAQRTPEIGLRIALGADRGSVLGMVLRQGAGVMGLGIVSGLVAALALTRLLRSFLFDVGPTDAVSLAAASLLLAIVGLAACSLPGWRAARTDPGQALLRQ